MTRKQAERIIREVQEQMGCLHWEVELALDEPPPKETTAADMWRASLYDTAKLRLNKNWRRWSEYEFRQNVIHEFGHLLTRDLEEAFFDVKEFVGELEWGPMQQRWHQEIEGVVDRYATIIARSAK